MLKMIIADDEQIILDGLKESIDWASFDIHVAGTALNGAEAVELVRFVKPDIVITDIKMPVLNGLELIREIRRLGNDVKIILISAYEQFDFAQEAISLGVVSYITKPLKKQKIIEEVVKVRDTILSERRELDSKARYEELYLGNLPILQQHYQNNLIMGKGRLSGDCQRQLKAYDIDLDEENIGVVVFTLDNPEETSEDFFEKSIQIILLRIGEMIKDMLPKAIKRTVFQSYNNEVVTIYNAGSDHAAVIRAVTLTAEAIKNTLRRSTCISISAGAGRIYPTLRDAPLSYKEAVKALNYRLVYGNNTVLYIDNIEIKEVKKTHIFDDLNDLLANVRNVLWTGKEEEVMKLIDRKLSHIAGLKCIPYYCIQQVYCQLLSALFNTMYEMNIQAEQLYGEPVGLYGELFKKHTLEELQRWFQDLISRACSLINERKSARCSNVINTALIYIRKNCSRDLSLVEVADHVNLNPSYLSRIFKEEMGVQFVEYVRNTKMELAKELLKNSGKKIYEICEELGYQNVQYFSTIFKSTTGMTPLEFKKTGKY